MGEKLQRTDRLIEEVLESMHQTFFKESGTGFEVLIFRI